MKHSELEKAINDTEYLAGCYGEESNPRIVFMVEAAKAYLKTLPEFSSKDVYRVSEEGSWGSIGSVDTPAEVGNAITNSIDGFGSKWFKVTKAIATVRN